MIGPILLLVFAVAAYFWGSLRELGLKASLGSAAVSTIPKDAIIPVVPTLPAAPLAQNLVQGIAENLNVPWELVWLPDGSLLVTERPGTLVRVSPSGQRTTIPFPGQVTQVSESGLLGMALDPEFSQNQFIYFYHTTGQGASLRNRVVRYQLNNDALANETIILDNIPAGNFHDGGRIKFGPDNLLYIATGDAGQENLAQDLRSSAGKILRVEEGGVVRTISSGHRNVQGLAWDSTGNLWATEHGRSGIQSGFDELNLIQAEQDYGWPNLEGDEQQDGFVSPIIHSGASETWAPSGAAFANGSIFFAGLRGETLYEAKLSGTQVVEFKRHFAGEFGRLRTVNIGPDGALYLLTNNTDGRGTPKEGDDKIIRIDPAALGE